MFRQTEQVGCEVLKIGACAKIGYSGAVRMPNYFGDRTQDEAYVRAKEEFLLDIDPHEDKRSGGHLLNRDLVALFACAYYFPPCTKNGTVVPPCRTLCEG